MLQIYETSDSRNGSRSKVRTGNTFRDSLLPHLGLCYFLWAPLLQEELITPWESSEFIPFVIIFSEQSVSFSKVKFVAPKREMLLKSISPCILPPNACPAPSFLEGNTRKGVTQELKEEIKRKKFRLSVFKRLLHICIYQSVGLPSTGKYQTLNG